MAFWRKKKGNLIPPVDENSSNQLTSSGTANRPSPHPSSRSSSATYVASGDGDPLSKTSNHYTRQTVFGEVNTHDDADLKKARNELFAGYKPQSGSGRFSDNGDKFSRRRTPPPGEDEDEDVEGLKQVTRQVNQESVKATRNALRLAREAEEAASGIIDKLKAQSEGLSATERHLILADGHAEAAGDRTRELKKLNRSIFIPVITVKSKREAKEAVLQQRHKAHGDAIDIAKLKARATHKVLDEGRGFARNPGTSEARGDRSRYQFESTASDDEREDELDRNLVEIDGAARRMKIMGEAMGKALDEQNHIIGGLNENTAHLDERLYRQTQRLQGIN